MCSDQQVTCQTFPKDHNKQIMEYIVFLVEHVPDWFYVIVVL